MDAGNRYSLGFGDGGNGTTFDIDPAGNVQYTGFPNETAKMTISGSSISFLTVPIDIIPQGGFAGQYRFGRSGMTLLIGPHTVHFVPAGVYALEAHLVLHRAGAGGTHMADARAIMERMSRHLSGPALEPFWQNNLTARGVLAEEARA